MKPIERITICGVGVDGISLDGVLLKVEEAISRKTHGYIVTPNSEIVLKAQRDVELKNIINNSFLSIPDGTGVVMAMAMRRQGGRDVRRVTGVDLMSEILDVGNKKRWRVFFLGAKPGVASSLRSRLKESHPDLNVVGAYAGSREVEGDPKSREYILDTGPVDVLFVAFGAPHQEKWIQRNRDALKNVTLMMGVGGSFDILAGNIRRAPKFMQDIGVEWLFRLIREPKRILRVLRALWFGISSRFCSFK